MLGICGGYQMLGRVVPIRDGVEGRRRASEGLGLLDVETVMAGEKTLARVAASHAASGTAIEAYEIHMGATAGPDCARPFAHIVDRPEGALSWDGQVSGTYLHGVFTSDAFRAAWLAGLGVAAGGTGYGARVEAILDRLAAHMEAHLDVDAILDAALPVAVPG